MKIEKAVKEHVAVKMVEGRKNEYFTNDVQIEVCKSVNSYVNHCFMYCRYCISGCVPGLCVVYYYSIVVHLYFFAVWYLFQF